MLKINKKRISIYAAVMGLLVFLYFLGVLSPIEKIIESTLNPALSRVYSLNINLRANHNEKLEKENLIKKIDKLEEERNLLLYKNSLLRTLEEENKLLRENLRFLTKNEYKFLMSNVISQGDMMDTSQETETIIIDNGSTDGIIEGLAVLNSQGIIIGKIAEVKEKISKVYLTHNKKCKLAATILNDERTSGIAEGELGLTIKMNYIPQTKEVHIDDTVISSGLEQTIPLGLVIGKVTKVTKENNELWQTAVIEPLVLADNLFFVSVLLP